MAGAFLLGGAALFIVLAQLAAFLIYLLFQVVVMLIQEVTRNSQEKAAYADRIRAAQPYAPAPMMRDLPILKGRYRPRVAVERRRRWFRC